jgi:hypothetical protein
MSLLVDHIGIANYAGAAHIPGDCVLAIVVVGIPAGKMDKLDLFAAPFNLLFVIQSTSIQTHVSRITILTRRRMY